MKYLSQRDPLWSLVKLGASSLTVGRYGCTTTCISMLSDYFGCYRNPGDLAKNAANYTPDGLVNWSKLKFQFFSFKERVFGEQKPRILAAMKDPAQAVILQVDGFHWVVGISKALLRDDWVIIDPWDGKKKNLKSSYKAVTGAAFFSR